MVHCELRNGYNVQILTLLRSAFKYTMQAKIVIHVLLVSINYDLK
jgi:hypothetical protein